MAAPYLAFFGDAASFLARIRGFAYRFISLYCDFFVPDGFTSGTIGLYGNSCRYLYVCVSVMA